LIGTPAGARRLRLIVLPADVARATPVFVFSLVRERKNHRAAFLAALLRVKQ
jgi:hypothetical protein